MRRFVKAEGGELQRAWSLLAAGDELVLEEGEHVLTSPLVLGGIQVRLSCQQAEKEGRAGSKPSCSSGFGMGLAAF